MTFTQAAEAHLDDVYGYLAWFTGDRAAADDRYVVVVHPRYE